MEGSILIMPIERVLKPLVIRRSGEQERQKQRNQQHSGYSGSDQKTPEKEARPDPKALGGIIAEHHRIDYRV